MNTMHENDLIAAYEDDEPLYPTQGGGLAAYDSINKQYYWVEEPEGWTGSIWVPSNWGIGPALTREKGEA
jgi:hypothetical protein